MKVEEIIEFIQSADAEDIELINHACKNREKPPRVSKSKLISDDIKRLAEVLPRTTTEYKGKKYEKTCAYFVRVLRDLADVVCHSYYAHYSTRGYPVWGAHDSIAESRAETYKEVYHTLAQTLIDLIEQSGFHYD